MTLSQKVLDASQGRDRVIDTVKALALALVILGHCLAWTTLPNGTVTNTLEQAPSLYPLTWLLQVLPLFFLMAGAGLAKAARTPSSTTILKRIDRLTGPTLPLLLVTLALSAGIGVFSSPSVAQAAGLLPIQLTWFIGVYLIVIAISPLLARMDTPWHFAGLLAAIGCVDAIRTLWLPDFGWVNLVLVWALFAAIGMHLPTLRRLPVIVPASAAILSAATAVATVTFGPYSKALITTQALPGLSNLAPPTIVLALAGITQISLLLCAWKPLERLLANDKLWIPVAIFSSRAMGLYLYHMLILSVIVAALLALGFAPVPLSGAWWAAHALVLLAVAGTAWALAPTLLLVGNATSKVLAQLVPHKARNAIASTPVWVATVWAAALGVAYMIQSESGIGKPLEMRDVLHLPYLPLVTVAGITISAALARAAGMVRANPQTRQQDKPTQTS